jgi:hypothetical protein
MSGEIDSTNAFISDPVDYFDWSATRLWSMPRADRERLQLEGLKLRFDSLREGVGYLKKLADRQGVEKIEAVEDVVPLLFEHTVYKSYPSSLLEKGRFAAINAWLDKLTTVPLTDVDVSDCDSIDSWIATMDRETELCIHHSSGTSGTVSLFPKSKNELSVFGKLYPMRFQKFGDPRPAEPQPKAHVISPSFRTGTSAHFRINQQYFERVAHGDEAFMHTAFPGAMSADILYLAGRLRAAKARGELDRLEIAPNLLARLTEFETDQAARATRMQEFMESVTSELAGKRVFMAGEWARECLRARLGGFHGRGREGNGASGGVEGQSHALRGRGSLARQLCDDGNERQQHALRARSLPSRALGDPVRSGPRNQRAPAAKREGQRSLRLLRPCSRHPLGRLHHRRRSHDRLRRRLRLRALGTVHRGRNLALQRTTRR